MRAASAVGARDTDGGETDETTVGTRGARHRRLSGGRCKNIAPAGGEAIFRAVFFLALGSVSRHTRRRASRSLRDPERPDPMFVLVFTFLRTIFKTQVH